ncbi:endothelin-converting enzyme 1-like [Tachypleus tridentatus]|uniref:endothelin-converting enzyme 1-like n=1 Tax=Tachypleus tridentatus TaxID=6853 RepID=UPI003FD0D124
MTDILDEENAELKENDNCIENENVHQKKESRTWKESCHNIPTTSLIIFLLCVILVIMFMSMLIFAVKTGSFKKQKEYFCESHGCLKVAAASLSRMNASYDPCTNFWDYACNGWMKFHKFRDGKGSRSVKDVMRDQIFHQLRFLIDLVPDNTDEQSPERKVKKFYGSCMNTENIEFTSYRNMQNKIYELGGWNIIPGTWSQKRWNKDRMIVELHQKYRVNVFFKIDVGLDDRNLSANIIKIEPANIGLPDPSYYHSPNEDQIIRAYKKFIQELANEFSCKPGHAYHFSEKIFQFEKEIAKILPSREMLLNSEESYKKMSIKELRSLAPNFKWLDLLQAWFSPSGIHVEMQVAVVYPQYFEHLFYLVATKTDEDINNYLMWRFQLHYLEHLPVRFQYLLTKFRQSLEGVEDHQVKEEERWHFCLRQTNHFMGIAMGNMYIKKYLSSDIKLEAETVLNKTKESFVRAIGDIGWLHNEEEQETAKRKINSLIVLWGYPDILLDENKITDYYVEFIVRTNYLQNVFEGEYFLWKKKQKNLLSSPIPESWSVLPQSVESVYETLGNHLVVPVGMLRVPFFEAGQPEAWKYGAFGTQLAGKMFQAFDMKGLQYQEHGQLETWMSNSSMKIYLDRVKCLNNQMFELLNKIKMINPMLWSVKLLSDIGGVKLAFQAYKKYVESENNSFSLPGIGNYDKLFFIAYAQSMCEILRKEKVETQQKSLESPNMIRVMSTLQQVSDFSDTFNCPAGSTMNPVEKCRVW